MDLTEKYLERLPQDTLNKLKLASYRAVDLIELFFPDPNDYSKKIKLDPFQKDFIDTIQFGFPVSKFSFSEVINPPSGVIAISRRQIGKSICCGYASAALMILGATSVGKPPCKNGIIAASQEESQILIEKVKLCFDESDFNEFVIGRPKLDFIRLMNGSFTKSHACSHKSIRGASYHYLLIDEAAIMDESVLFSAAIPTVEHGERWIVITTPQGSRGKMIQMFCKAVESRPITCTKCGAEYSQTSFIGAKFPEKNEIWKMPKLPPCEMCGSTSYKYGIGLWATPWFNPWEMEIIDNKKLKQTLDSFSWSPWARQEYLGEILDEAAMVILEEWIDNCTNQNLRNVMSFDENVRYILGLDYGRLHDASSFCITHFDKKTKKITLDYMRTVSGEFDYETDYDKIHKHLEQIVKFYKPVLIIPDATGLGYSQVERMQKDLKKWGVRSKIYTNVKSKKDNPRLGFVISKTVKQELISNLITKFSMNPPVLQIPPKTEPEIGELIKELLRFECEVKEGGYIKYGTQDYHDDRVIALALSLWGHNTKRVPVGKPRGVIYDVIGTQNHYGRNITKSNSKYKLIDDMF